MKHSDIISRMNASNLGQRTTPGAGVESHGPSAWRLVIPPGPAGVYRWSQLDDYLVLPRWRFPHRPPFSLMLRARVSAENLQGTWGMGLWNDPFSAGMGLGGAGLRFPALPNAAWFFHASPPNHLALRDEIPGNGLLAGVFRAPLLPGVLLLPAAPAALLLVWPAAARLLRRLAARIVRDDAVLLNLNPILWHEYRIDWEERRVVFTLDGGRVFETRFAPRGRLGLVIWIDNQYAAFPPDGRIRSGTLETAERAWLDVEFLS